MDPGFHCPTATISDRLALTARDIKLSHSVFALPFALLATFLAADAADPARLPRINTLGLIILCMVLARTVAMTFNRWADRKLDALNPRTASRAIPSGKVRASFMITVMVFCALGFVAAAGGFLINGNPWPVILSPVVLAWLCLYSLTKRFTWLCHLFLGSALALSPLAAVLAVEPAFLDKIDPYLLAGAILCWVAGFDVIYALLDTTVDRETAVHSMPANLGVGKALWISRALHAACAGALVSLCLVSDQLHLGFGIAVALVIGLLVLEHALIWGSRIHRIHVAFFTVNGVISLLVGTAGIADVVWTVGQ